MAAVPKRGARVPVGLTEKIATASKGARNGGLQRPAVDVFRRGSSSNKNILVPRRGIEPRSLIY